MKITYYVAASIDGFIARSDGSVDWLEQVNQSDEDFSYTAFYNSVDALVMGRVTYEQVLSFGDWLYPDKPTFILTSHSLATDHN
ncbi:MAG: dihydrofolate reductase, partial [Candidatus Marinimicrobia bacterium]|nr:dihydrofolate reductase [Candidatus Neomarinimicrobiota bacterium]